jgi:dCTP deaminase
MFLSDRDIKQALKDKKITIRDFDPARLQPASYDVLLGNEFMMFDKHTMDLIDPLKPVDHDMRTIKVADDGFFVLHPGEFALAVTKDYFGVGSEFCCEIMGKSSLARLGLIIHTTAGFVDPGNELQATLELFNTNSLPVKLYPGMKIAQIAFCQLSSPAERPYGHKDLNSKYYQAKTVQASQMWRNYAGVPQPSK